MTNTIIMQVTLQDLCQSVALDESILLEVIEHGIANPVSGSDAQSWLFEEHVVNVVKKAFRLHRDLGIEWQAIALVLELLEQRDQLQAENAQLRQRLSRFIED
jgi:chaperone modulatory protein CbpM